MDERDVVHSLEAFQAELLSAQATMLEELSHGKGLSYGIQVRDRVVERLAQYLRDHVSDDEADKVFATTFSEDTLRDQINAVDDVVAYLKALLADVRAGHVPVLPVIRNGSGDTANGPLTIRSLKFAILHALSRVRHLNKFNAIGRVNRATWSFSLVFALQLGNGRWPTRLSGNLSRRASSARPTPTPWPLMHGSKSQNPGEKLLTGALLIHLTRRY